MKKDFSQPFVLRRSIVDLIIGDGASGRIFLLRSTHEHEEDFYRVFEPGTR
jgi:hypothetical protein